MVSYLAFSLPLLLMPPTLYLSRIPSIANPPPVDHSSHAALHRNQVVAFTIVTFNRLSPLLPSNHSSLPLSSQVIHLFLSVVLSIYWLCIYFKGKVVFLLFKNSILSRQEEID